MANFVLDAYTVLTLLTDDAGADEVREFLTNPESPLRMGVAQPRRSPLRRARHQRERSGGGCRTPRVRAGER